MLLKNPIKRAKPLQCYRFSFPWDFSTQSVFRMIKIEVDLRKTVLVGKAMFKTDKAKTYYFCFKTNKASANQELYPRTLQFYTLPFRVEFALNLSTGWQGIKKIKRIHSKHFSPNPTYVLKTLLTSTKFVFRGFNPLF